MEVTFDVYEVQMSNSGSSKNFQLDNIAGLGEAVALWKDVFQQLEQHELKAESEVEAVILDWHDNQEALLYGEVRRGRYGDMGTLRKILRGEALAADPQNGYFLPVFFSAFLPKDSRRGLLLLERRYGHSILDFFRVNFRLALRDRFSVALKLRNLFTHEQFDALMDGSGHSLTFYSSKPPTNALQPLVDMGWAQETIRTKYSLKVEGKFGASLKFLRTAATRDRVFALAPPEMEVDRAVLSGTSHGAKFSLNLETGQFPRASVSVIVNDSLTDSRPSRAQYLHACRQATEIIRERISRSEELAT